MLTTTQVRAIIRKHTVNTQWGVWTNKTTGYTGPERRVKCYFRDNIELLTALRKAAGENNVYLTDNGMGSGIIVKCVLG